MNRLVVPVGCPKPPGGLRRPAAAAQAKLSTSLWTTQDFLFQSYGNAVSSYSIKTQTRGRSPCSEPLQSLLYLLCHLPVALKTRHRVVLSGRPAGRLSLTRSMATPLPGRLSVALQALQPAASMSVCRPATDLATGNGRIFSQRPSGQIARMAFLHARRAD